MPYCYFAIGTTLANMANLEITLPNEPPPTVLDGRRIPLLGPAAQRTLDQSVHRHGAVNVPVRIDVMRQTSLDTFITTYFSNYLTASAALYASWLDETGHYSPFSVTLERPYEGVHYRVVDGVNVRDLEIPGYKWTLQTNTENSSTTITTSERYTESDTTAGAVVLTLPAANAVTPYTIYSAKKTGGGNALSFTRAGSDTIDGGTSLTITTREDIYSDGVSAWFSL